MNEELIFDLLQQISGSKKNAAQAEKALSQLYSCYGDVVHSACNLIGWRFGKTKERIEDLEQDVWLILSTKAHSFDPAKSKAKTEEKKFFNWVAMIAKNILIQEHKTELPISFVGDGTEEVQAKQDITEETDSEENSASAELNEEVRKYLHSLQVHEQDIIYTTRRFRPYNVPRGENIRLRETHHLTASNIRQIRRRILLALAALLIDRK